ncbi:NADP-dependent oxidoreductase [Salinibacterium sp. ZJ450]|uniref:NADP-dependent oxidoreductase n=1 Tax=Salinibacterium sp. ZJ450 TaxID=2708338 RepID=UPI00141F4345|nr:NADP-dependent oxidoreductase [Salinibacterium sp. ZJ450]
MRTVIFTEFGGPEVLQLVEVPPPTAGPGEVRVRVVIAGLNPVDAKIFSGGPSAERYGVTLPSGNGNDFAGVVDEVGRGVAGIQAGDRVYGGVRGFAQADFVITDAAHLLPLPPGLDLERAGALDIAGRTAWAAVRSLGITATDTVLVSAAAGGVGVLAAQLAVRSGATVIGTASEANHDFLRSLGVIPVSYGDGLAGRLRELAPDGITAVLDQNGRATIDVALELGVPASRINTIAAKTYRPELGMGTVGGPAAGREELAEMARLVASGEIRLPIDSIYPIERVQDAYRHLMAGHVRGKVLLATE